MKWLWLTVKSLDYHIQIVLNSLSVVCVTFLARPRRNPRRRSNPDADRNKSDALPDGIQDHPRRGRGRGGGRGRGRGRGRGYRGNNSRRMSNMNLQGQVMA